MSKRELEEFKKTLKELEGCCLAHPQDFAVDDVVEVVEWSGPSGDSTEYGLYKTAAGRFGVVIDYSDYTGHG